MKHFELQCLNLVCLAVYSSWFVVCVCDLQRVVGESLGRGGVLDLRPKVSCFCISRQGGV